MKIDTQLDQSPATHTMAASFTAAVLLTGNLLDAETVLLEAINPRSHGDPGDRTTAILPERVAVAVINMGSAREPDLPGGDYPCALPREIRTVLRLAPELRQCFVLRVLMAMPHDFCARLLRLDRKTLDWKITLAAQALAEMSRA